MTARGGYRTAGPRARGSRPGSGREEILAAAVHASDRRIHRDHARLCAEAPKGAVLVTAPFCVSGSIVVADRRPGGH